MPTALITGGTTGSAERRPSCCMPATTRSRSPDRILIPSHGHGPSSLTMCSSSDPMRGCSPIRRFDVNGVGAVRVTGPALPQRRDIPPGTGGRCDGESFDEHADLNFKGQYFTLQKALPLMNDGSSIVLTVGIGARRGSPGATVGAATRGALLAMLPSLALELAPRRIRVNAVSPGPPTPHCSTSWECPRAAGMPCARRSLSSASDPARRRGSSRLPRLGRRQLYHRPGRRRGRRLRARSRMSTNGPTTGPHATHARNHTAQENTMALTLDTYRQLDVPACGSRHSRSARPPSATTGAGRGAGRRAETVRPLRRAGWELHRHRGHLYQRHLRAHARRVRP